MNAMIQLERTTRELLTEVCDHYEKSAPTVAAWANDLYTRMNENADAVTLSEVRFAHNLRNPEWEQPNFAANLLYKLLHRLGRDVTGHAGF